MTGLASSALVLAALLAGQPVAGQPDELAGDSRHAKEMMAAGRYEEAIPIYRRLVQAVPGNPGLLLNLALAQHMAGHEREAIPNLEAVLKTQPRLVPALIALGSARLSINQPTQALLPLRKAVGIAPESPDALAMLAQTLGQLGQFGQAAECYRKLTELSPDAPGGWYGLGSTYEAIATGAFDRLRSVAPDSPYIDALVADTRVQRGQFSSAFLFYRKALRQLPGLHGIHSALADVYRKTGHAEWAAAEDAKERALPPADCKQHEAECQFAGGHDLLAATLRQGVTPSAEALFWQAKAANELALQAFFRLGELPESLELHQLRAEIARNRNQHLEAVKEWRAALRLSDDVRTRQELAISLFMAQDFRSAVDEASALLKANPRSPELNFIAGDSFLRLEEPDKAVPLLHAALASDPKLLAADASLGLALARMGKSAEAIPHLERALELDDDGNLHYQLARAYQASGNAEKARGAMARYQEILKNNQEQKQEVAREAQIGPPQ